jgi:hypothetical protein
MTYANATVGPPREPTPCTSTSARRCNAKSVQAGAGGYDGGMRNVFGGIAILLAVVCFVNVLAWLQSMSGVSWTHIPHNMARMPLNSAIGWIAATRAAGRRRRAALPIGDCLRSGRPAQATLI